MLFSEPFTSESFVFFSLKPQSMGGAWAAKLREASNRTGSRRDQRAERMANQAEQEAERGQPGVAQRELGRLGRGWAADLQGRAGERQQPALARTSGEASPT